MHPRSHIRCIVPPDILQAVIREGTEEEREAALDTMATDQTFRLARAAVAATLGTFRGQLKVTGGGTGGQPQRTIYDQKGSESMAAGVVVRCEGGDPVDDPAVNEAYDGFGATYEFFWDVFERNSMDGQGMPIHGMVHFGRKYANAFWDGEGNMFFGDGDGQLFTRLTKSLDVIGHELAHGVTQYEANLAYSHQSGALNESMSDVFGSLVKQRHLNQTADQADWLIGVDVVGPALAPALRSLKEPGTANQYDQQPGTMSDFVNTPADNGGVHINSGIPNRAFSIVATTLGGNAWEDAGQIWYEALRDPVLRPNATFRSFARITVRQAQRLYGAGAAQVQAVRDGWEAVEVAL